MDNKFLENPKITKALADASRLMIINMLSDQELCDCKILENMNISKPRFSHHMKVLCSSGLVISRREGESMYYRLTNDALTSFKPLFDDIMAKTKSTICW